MIIIDTNIISTFCRIDQLPILFQLFPQDKFGITPAVYDELMEAIPLGFSFLEQAKSSIESGDLQIIPLQPEEIQSKQNLPRSFGPGDLESVIICQHRSYVLLTNDKRLRNFCKDEGITFYDLPMLLRALWENGVYPKQKVRQFISEIEAKENMVIKKKEEIFQD